MTARMRIALALALALVAAPAATAEKAPAAKPARAAVARTAADSSRTAPPKARASARRLEDVYIEGEIPVPQVLFITARDQRRVVEFQHRRYLRTSRQLGEQTPLPSRIVVTEERRPEVRKENHP
jgi:hypothetical protein